MIRYRFSKCRRLLKQGVDLYEKKRNRLSEHDLKEFERFLEGLDQALIRKDRAECKRLAPQLESFIHKHFPKSSIKKFTEGVFALVVAIAIAFLIREMWFELYEVPTGSMRPTIEEKDRMVVSKTTFGIHLPFTKDLQFFNEDEIKRQGIIVFTVDGMDVSDPDTVYFYLFPGKKRFIKRALGRGGDTLYFYGGRIYGIDREGKPLTTLYETDELKNLSVEKIDHIPFITFEGKVSLEDQLSRGIYGKATVSQMNMPVTALEFKHGRIEGYFFNGKEWVLDDVKALKSPHKAPVSFSDLWGMGNYAMARLLTKKEATNFYGTLPGDGLLYLELRHTPNLLQSEMRRGESGRIFPQMTPFASLIPLSEEHLCAIQEALYTSRFIVKNGRAYRYGEGTLQNSEFAPRFEGIPDGMYEFYYGKGYKIHWGGFSSKLPDDHPLYSHAAESIQKLFNLGVGFHVAFDPLAPNQPYNPQRFAYYRDGDLYLMGAPILKKNDPTLLSFIEKENAKSTSEPNYVPFVDRGAPLKDGNIDAEFIKAFGLKIPENTVLALGDNYSMSADSRDFGFVPMQNLRGAPSFTFWPFSKRVGTLPQAHTPWLTLPNMVIWILALVIIAAILLYTRHRRRVGYFRKRD